MQDNIRSKLTVLAPTLILIIFSVLPQTGCNSTDKQPPRPMPGSPLHQNASFLPPLMPETMEAQSYSVQEPVDELTLPQALAAALDRNPTLAAASWEVHAAEAGSTQAGLRPNPEVRVQIEDFGGTGQFNGFGESEQRIRFSQVFELGAKASKRQQVAGFVTDLSGWDYQTMRLNVLNETTKAFVSVQAAEKRFAAAQEMQELAQSVMASVSQRAGVGATVELEAKQAQIEFGISQSELERARYELEAARVRLAGYWGGTHPKFTRIVGELDTLTDVPPLEKLLPIISRNPDVARWQTETSLRQADRELEESNSIPDLRMLAGVRRLQDSGDHGYSIASEMSLPIFNRNQGAINQARLRHIKAAHEQHAAEVTAATALREAHQILSASYREVMLLKEVVLPAAHAALDISRLLVEKGVETDLEVLKAQRDLFDAQTRLSDALQTYHWALADIERLIAGPIKALD
jgi:cobalt-zinc-cadmium efflux system outer membrane protein